MKYRLLFAEFNKETGISKAIIQTDLGIFTGQTILHEEDKDIASNFQGCMYAETRAVTNYVKEKCRILNIEIKTLSNLLDNLKQLRCYNADNKEMRFIFNTLNKKQKRYEKLKNQIIMVEENLYRQMRDYRQEHEAFMKKIDKKESAE